MKGLKDRVALVSGGTGLLGRAIAARLASEQAVVVVTSRDLAKAQRWAAENAGNGRRFIPAQLDLGDEESIRSCVDYVAPRVGVPTIVVANASLREGLGLPFAKITHTSFEKLFGVDVAGHVLLMRECVDRLAGEPASMVFLSSIYGQCGVDHNIYPENMPTAPVQYAAVKSGMQGTVRWLAALWGDRGVRVNVVVPGGVISEPTQPLEFVQKYSEKTMLRRMASADEVASAAAFLASDEASYVTGQCLVVDGGYTAW